MLLLLPPSEGKTPAPAGRRPVDLAALSHPELTAERDRVIDALVAACALPGAARLLGVGDSLGAEVERTAQVRTQPAAPAAQVYTGVLYGAARLPELVGTGRRRAGASVRIISALWGALGPWDRIPAYRLPMTARLPGLGPLAGHWAGALRGVLTGDPGVVIDCRSGAYVPAWRPPSGTPWLSVRVLAEVRGVRTVVSHHAKHTRGVLTHHLLTREAPPPRTPAQVLLAARELVPGVLRGASLVGGGAAAPATLELVLA